MSLSQWELFWWRTKLFTQPQPKYYAYQEELRNNPLIERSINLITLVRILLIVVTIPTEGIWNRQWNSEKHANQRWAARVKMAPRTSGSASGRLSSSNEVGKRSNCQLDLGGQVLTDRANFESALQTGDGDAGRTSPSLIRPSSLNCCLSEYYV